jgi:hypothetical protein
MTLCGYGNAEEFQVTPPPEINSSLADPLSTTTLDTTRRYIDNHQNEIAKIGFKNWDTPMIKSTQH